MSAAWARYKETLPGALNQPTKPTAQTPTSGGRLGSPAVRAQNTAIGDYLTSSGYNITGGGGRMPEEYLPGPGLGTKGSNFVDITAEKDGVTIRINTVDVCADGVTPTARERRTAESIDAKTGNRIILIPKGSGLGDLPNILNNGG